MRKPRQRRDKLIADLVTELEIGGDGISALYAGLLARALMARDATLAQKYERQLVDLLPEDRACAEPVPRTVLRRVRR